MLRIPKLWQFFVGFVAFSLTITGCDGCDPYAQVNNFTATPTEHVYQISGTEVANLLTTQNTGNSNCTPAQTFTARVMITVRTAEVVNGTLTPNAQPYREIDDNFSFQKNTGFNNPGAKITIPVPDRGAYAIFMNIELQECSGCCNGFTEAVHCSSLKNNCANFDCRCSTGKPKLAFEKIFTTDNRPDSRDNSTGVNLQITSNDLLIRKCYGCSSCLDQPCKL